MHEPNTTHAHFVTIKFWTFIRFRGWRVGPETTFVLQLSHVSKQLDAIFSSSVQYFLNLFVLPFAMPSAIQAQFCSVLFFLFFCLVSNVYEASSAQHLPHDAGHALWCFGTWHFLTRSLPLRASQPQFLFFLFLFLLKSLSGS